MLQRRYIFGLFAITGVVACWVGASFVTSYILLEQDYNKPFFLTYFNTCTFTFYLFIHKLKKRANAEALPLLLDRSARLVEMAKLALKFCGLWFAANLAQNASLAYTSVASSTVMSSTSGIFTLLLGALTGIEHVSVLRISAVLASLLGVILVVYAPIHQERKEMPHQLFGQMLALLGAFFYGCYSILLKRNIHHERDTTLFFGLVGLFNMLGLWPVLVMLDRWQIESWHWPSTVTTWALIISNALLGTFLSDYLWLLAILLTSPLIVTLGIALTIPIALLGDIIFKGVMVEGTFWLGASLVLVGFLGVHTEPSH